MSLAGVEVADAAPRVSRSVWTLCSGKKSCHFSQGPAPAPGSPEVWQHPCPCKEQTEQCFVTIGHEMKMLDSSQ